jgi:hypothetical protein
MWAIHSIRRWYFTKQRSCAFSHISTVAAGLVKLCTKGIIESLCSVTSTYKLTRGPGNYEFWEDQCHDHDA